MTCAFCLFRLPSQWCPYFGIGLPVKLSDLKGNPEARRRSLTMAKDNDSSETGYLCLQVLPMGWLSAVGIMQAVHRRLLGSQLEHGAGLPENREIRKTAVLPTSEDQRCKGGWQAYLDNFAAIEVVKRHDFTKSEKELASWHQAARACWRRYNIPSAQDKSVPQSLEAKELGCFVDGDFGSLGTTVQRRLEAIALGCFVCSTYKPHLMWLAALAGRNNFVFQFRRPASCIYFQTWRAIAQWKDCRYIPREVGRELVMAMLLMPIMTTKLRTRPDALVTCSDASETGAGVAAAAGLTDYGVSAALSLPTELPPPKMKGFVLLSLFGGIEASRRALDLLGIQAARHISVEIESTAKRAAHEVYPDLVHYRDICEFRREQIHAALAGLDVTFVLTTSGSPCS